MTIGPDDDLPPGAVRIDPDEDDDELAEVGNPAGLRWWESFLSAAPLALAAALLSFVALGVSALDLSSEVIGAPPDDAISGLRRAAIGQVTVHLIVGGIALALALAALYLSDDEDRAWARHVAHAAALAAGIGLLLHGVALGLDIAHTNHTNLPIVGS